MSERELPAVRYRVELGCGHESEPPFTVSSIAPTTAALSYCLKCDRHVPICVISEPLSAAVGDSGAAG